MGKHKYSKGLGFLHIPHSSISREIETYAIPKTWENWMLIARETYGKTQTFHLFVSFLNTLGEAEIDTIYKSWEKWIPIIREKYGKSKHSKGISFSNIWIKKKSIQFPKYGKS